MAITDGLISYYKLDGDATDVLGTNNGTATNVTWAEGKINNGGSFNGTSSRIQTNAYPSTNLTISTWINPSNITGEKYILSDWSASYRNFFFAANGSSIRCISGNGLTSQSAEIIGGTITAGNRHNVVVTRNSGTVKIYVNGVEVATSATSYSGAATSNNKYIGASSDLYGSSFFGGLIDEVGIWNRALTQDEITQLYNGGNGLAYPFAINYGIVNEPTRTRYRNELGQIDGGAIHTMVERYRKRGKLGQIDAVRPSSGGITLTIDHTKVSDDLTNFPVYVNLNDVKSGITLTEAQSIRVYKADGTTELPRDIVTKDKMRFKADLSSSTDTVFKIKMDGVSADYGVSDTYGRNNVYTKYKAFYDFASGNSNDRTGNGYNGSDSNMSYSGDYASFNGSSSVVRLGNILNLPSVGITLSFSTTDGESCLIQKKKHATNGGYHGYALSFNSGKIRYRVSYGSGSTNFADLTTGGTYKDGDKHYIVGEYIGGNQKLYVDGLLNLSQSKGSTIYYDSNEGLYFGADALSTSNMYSYFNGKIYYIGINDAGFPSSRVSTEYNNQSSPSTFYTIS